MSKAVLSEDELWIGEMRGIAVGSERLLVVRLEHGVCVYRDRCPHQGYPLSEGKLERGIITCRVHEHSFDAASGEGINPLGSRLTKLPACVQGGQILVELPASSGARP